MKKLVLLTLLCVSLNAIADSTWMRKSTIFVYSYIYEGAIIKEFDVPNRQGPQNDPMFFANCAINRINERSDEEARFISWERVDIYCGRNPVVSVSGLTETGIDRTNLFGDTILEAEDRSWVVFLPSNDSAVPGYAHLTSEGVLTLKELKEYAVFSDFTELDSTNTSDESVTLNVLAIDPENRSMDERVGSNLMIYSNGDYKFNYGTQ